MKVLTVDNHPNPRKEIPSMITGQPYLVPDPSGLGQSSDPADVSPFEANLNPLTYELERVLRTLGGSEGARTRGLLRERQALRPTELRPAQTGPYRYRAFLSAPLDSQNFPRMPS